MRLPTALRRAIRPVRPASERFFIATATSVELPASSPIRRTPRRPIDYRDVGFDQNYDATHLFYDVFWDGARIVLLGPDPNDLEPLITTGTFRADGVVLPAVERRPGILCAYTFIPCATRPRQLDFQTGELSWSLPMAPSPAPVFAGRKVLATLSRDNELRWIREWADFHVRAHGADAVLLYDNGSTSYEPEDVLETLRRVPGISAAVVVRWPYKFGPQRKIPPDYIWDSNYCQHVMLEDARRRFLPRAAAMVNLDIDELVVTDDGRTVFEHLAEAPGGALMYHGHWIGNVEPARPFLTRHRDYRHRPADDPPYPCKWAIDPSRLADATNTELHKLLPEADARLDPGITFRHFKALSTNWKYRRTKRQRLRPDKYAVDETWVAQMRKIGWIK